MLLSNERNYCHQWSSITAVCTVKGKAHWICSGVKVVCTVAVAVLAAGRTGPAAPGSERADRLHLLHVRCTALPAQCSHAEWCGARFATPPTCAPVSGVNTRRHAFALLEQCLYVRAAIKEVHAHHDFAHCSLVVAMHGLVRAAVNSSKLAVNRSTAAVVTRHERCAVSSHGCRIGSV